MVYDISYETLIGAKPLGITLDKVDEFIKTYDETRHLVVFGPEKCNAIYNSIRYMISQKSVITYVFMIHIITWCTLWQFLIKTETATTIALHWNKEQL